MFIRRKVGVATHTKSDGSVTLVLVSTGGSTPVSFEFTKDQWSTVKEASGWRAEGVDIYAIEGTMDHLVPFLQDTEVQPDRRTSFLGDLLHYLIYFLTLGFIYFCILVSCTMWFTLSYFYLVWYYLFTFPMRLLLRYGKCDWLLHVSFTAWWAWRQVALWAIEVLFWLSSKCLAGSEACASALYESVTGRSIS